MSANPNNTPEQKAKWESSKFCGSRFIKAHASKISSPKHRKGYRAKRGVFTTRVLQRIAGWKDAMERRRQWRKQMRQQGI